VGRRTGKGRSDLDLDNNLSRDPGLERPQNGPCEMFSCSGELDVLFGRLEPCPGAYSSFVNPSMRYKPIFCFKKPFDSVRKTSICIQIRIFKIRTKTLIKKTP
jgi:hypothetical protein